MKCSGNFVSLTYGLLSTQSGHPKFSVIPKKDFYGSIGSDTNFALKTSEFFLDPRYRSSRNSGLSTAIDEPYSDIVNKFILLSTPLV
jgi:hypothetical protein